MKETGNYGIVGVISTDADENTDANQSTKRISVIHVFSQRHPGQDIIARVTNP